MPAQTNPEVLSYYEATEELMRDIIGENVGTAPQLEELALDSSNEARDAEEKILRERVKIATRRLARLQSLNPPAEVSHIHQTYLKAFSFGLMARKEELKGNLLTAKAAYDASADEIKNADAMWEKLGFD